MEVSGNVGVVGIGPGSAVVLAGVSAGGGDAGPELDVAA